jgi:hypothetical protein
MLNEMYIKTIADRGAYIYMANNLCAWFVRHVWCHFSVQENIEAGKKQKLDMLAWRADVCLLDVFGHEDCSTYTCLVGPSSYNMNVVCTVICVDPMGLIKTVFRRLSLFNFMWTSHSKDLG